MGCHLMAHLGYLLAHHVTVATRHHKDNHLVTTLLSPSVFLRICLLIRKSLRASSKSTRSSGGLPSRIKTKGMEEFQLDSSSTDPAELVLQKRMAECSQWNRPAMSSPISSLVPQRSHNLLPPLLDLAAVHLGVADCLGSDYPPRWGGRPSPSD
jgi:hypothetical protein